MSRKRFNKDGSFIATNGNEDNEQQSPPPPNTTTNTMMLNNNVINNKTIFQNIDTTIPKQDSNFYKDNDNEKVILNNLHDRIKKLERLKDEWENLVLEGDILEKSYINIEEIIVINIHLILIDLIFFISIKFIILVKFSI